MQKVKVQDGVIRYTATDPTLFVDFSIIGQANVSRQLNIGDDPLAAGNITTPTGIDLNVIPGTGGNLELAVSSGGVLLINNAAWPSGLVTPDVGMYIGASALNVLEYYPFTLDFTANDALTVPQLNAAYPTIQPGQRVVGPTVIYECVAPSTWRIMGGGGSGPLPVSPTQVVFGDTSPGTVTSSANFVYDSITSTLTLGTAVPGLISSEIGQTLTVDGDTNLFLTSANGSVAVGSQTITNSSTAGFIYIPASTGGAPSGTPDSIPGMVPMYVDTSESTLYIYINGAWRGVPLV